MVGWDRFVVLKLVFFKVDGGVRLVDWICKVFN